MPGRVVDQDGVDESTVRLAARGSRSSDRLVLRVQVEQDADVAELEEPSTSDDPLAELGGGGDAPG